MSTRHERSIGRALVWALLSATIAGCGLHSAEELVNAANESLRRGDARSAIVEVKAALAQQPNHATGRLLLGRALIELDQPVAAVIELDKAELAGAPESAVKPLKALAHLQQRQFDKVIRLCGSLQGWEAAAVTECLALKAAALAGTGDKAGAEGAIEAALRLSPSATRALVVRARLQMASGDHVQALRTVDEVLTKTPGDAESLVVKADIVRSSGRHTEASDLYRAAVAAQPTYAVAHGRLLSSLLQGRDTASTQEALKQLKAVLPGSATTLYYQARVALVTGDVASAEAWTQQLIKAAPDNADILTLAGVIALQQRAGARAEAHIYKAVLLAPYDVGLKRLLARAYVASGQSERALDILRPELMGRSPTTEALSIAATAHFQAGDPARAKQLLERAVQGDPSAIEIRTRLALATAAGTGESNALHELEALAGREGGLFAALAMLPIQVNRRDFEGALRTIDRIALLEPKKARTNTLRAQVLAAKGDLVGARAELERALKLEPTFFAAASGLAALELKEGKTDQALAHYKRVLDAQPRQVEALLAIADLSARSMRPTAEVERLYEDAIAADPRRLDSRRALIEFCIRRNNAERALEFAQAASSSMPDQPEVIELLARTQLQAGELGQAISSFGRLSTALPGSTRPLLWLVDANLAADRNDAAQHAAKAALAIAPKDAEVIRKVLAVELRAGRWKEAKKVALAAQAALPLLGVGSEAEGDLERAQGRWSAAVTAYQTSLKLEANSSVAQKLHATLLRSGKAALAEDWATQWAKDHPQDARFFKYLGTRALATQDYQRAEANFAQVIRLTPDDAVALNNLGWSLLAQNKPGGLMHAERAYFLRPDDPVIVDTLAALMAQAGKFSHAVELQKRAIDLQPREHRWRLNLAKVYLKSGNKAAAQSELSDLIEVLQDSNLIKEVKKLQASIL